MFHYNKAGAPSLHPEFGATQKDCTWFKIIQTSQSSFSPTTNKRCGDSPGYGRCAPQTEHQQIFIISIDFKHAYVQTAEREKFKLAIQVVMSNV